MVDGRLRASGHRNSDLCIRTFGKLEARSNTHGCNEAILRQPDAAIIWQVLGADRCQFAPSDRHPDNAAVRHQPQLIAAWRKGDAVNLEIKNA